MLEHGEVSYADIESRVVINVEMSEEWRKADYADYMRKLLRDKDLQTQILQVYPPPGSVFMQGGFPMGGAGGNGGSGRVSFGGAAGGGGGHLGYPVADDAVPSEACPVCNGNGSKNGEECWHCEGSGLDE